MRDHGGVSDECRACLQHCSTKEPLSQLSFFPPKSLELRGKSELRLRFPIRAASLVPGCGS